MSEASMADRGDGGVRSIVRAAEVLALFDARHPDRSIREIVELTGLPKTTAVRILATLQSRGLVAVRSDGSYALGAGFLRWVRLSQSIWEVNASTRSVMRALVDACGETVNVYVRQDLDRISIAQEEGTATVRSVVDVGVPMPLSAGAAAKVLLGGTPDHVIDGLAAADPDVDPAALRAEVASVRKVGHAVTHGEREFGASAVAVPILNRDGRPIAALSVSGPSSRFTPERTEMYIREVAAAAEKISTEGLGSVEAFL